jgi:hypothetical protein
MKKLLPLLKRASRAACLAPLTSLLFCSSALASTPPLLRDPVEIALGQIGETGHRLGKTYEMIHFGEGMEKKFLRLQLSFRVKRKMSKNEARELLLVCAYRSNDPITYLDREGSKRYAHTMTTLKPHPDESKYFDHSIQSKTFQKPIRRDLQRYLSTGSL